MSATVNEAVSLAELKEFEAAAADEVRSYVCPAVPAIVLHAQ